jgi:hypothetical protein
VDAADHVGDRAGELDELLCGVAVVPGGAVVRSQATAGTGASEVRVAREPNMDK